MAKKKTAKGFSFQGFDNRHYQTTEAYVAVIEAMYAQATLEIAGIAVKENYNPNKPFSFDDYPKTKAIMQDAVRKLADNITAVVSTGSRKEWLYACQKNDEFVASIMDTSKLSKKRLDKMQDRNLDALKTFQERKINGMSLSQRVWKYCGQYKAQMEHGLDPHCRLFSSTPYLSSDYKF
jgi:hypothetical protein